MTIHFKPDETFRGDFTYRNSDTAILRFPFPFGEDRYIYAVNVEPHRRGGPTAAYDAAFDVDEHYIAECRERALTLASDPKRCQVLPHMMAAEWDTLELLMESLSTDYPDQFSLIRDDDTWTWVNRPLGIEDCFVFGRPETLPFRPFEYITRQVQGDFTIQDQRDGDLWMDGGMVTSQADWSLNFDLGMSFKQWHAPVPKAHEMGVFDRALQFRACSAEQPSRLRRLSRVIALMPAGSFRSAEQLTRSRAGREASCATLSGSCARRSQPARLRAVSPVRLPRLSGRCWSLSHLQTWSSPIHHQQSRRVTETGHVTPCSRQPIGNCSRKAADGSCQVRL